jgi:hypothetical protein
MTQSTAATISGGLIFHTRQLYWQALKGGISSEVAREGINVYAPLAPSAYIVTVAAVEAFVNEAFLSDTVRHFTKDSPLWSLSRDWIENLQLAHKLVLIPQLLFGQTFSRDSQPYQDMAVLIRVRNTFVHYKMKPSPYKFQKDLEQRSIAFSSAKYPWAYSLSTTEGIRWAHNTACEIAHSLAGFVTPGDQHRVIIGHAANFHRVEVSEVEAWFAKQGIDPSSNA